MGTITKEQPVQKSKEARISDKKVSNLLPSQEEFENNPFGFSGSLDKRKFAEVRDDTYICCCCCGSSTYNVTD